MMIPEEQRPIKGIGASAGVARGPCRIALNSGQLEALKDGDILVSRMTTPDLVLYMKKCVAIVTEYGGMFSHAAIVSRELRIPCVVGVRNATISLKNGMIVEVNGNKGIIRICSNDNNLEREIEDNTFSGGPVRLKMNRDKPLNSENWCYRWSSPNMNIEYDWITTMPELVNDPIGSMIISCIEKIPFVLGFEKVGPLYARFHNCLHYMRLDKLQETVRVFRERINEGFVNDYVHELQISEDYFDNVSDEVKSSIARSSALKTTDLLTLFMKWWKANDRFLAVRYLIQVIGDDIVWPRIRGMLSSNVPETEIEDCLSVLSLPTVETASIRFLRDFRELIESWAGACRIIFGDLDSREMLRALECSKEGKEWSDRLHSFCKTWGWVRTRIFYHEPIGEIERVLNYIKATGLGGFVLPRLEDNLQKFDNCLNKLRAELPEVEMKELLLYINFGKLLASEKDNHYYVFLKNSDSTRSLLLEVGRRLEQEKLLFDEKDVFFLLVNEIWELCSPDTTPDRKREVLAKIPNRMNAFTYAAGIVLHDHPGYGSGKEPFRDNEYF